MAVTAVQHRSIFGFSVATKTLAYTSNNTLGNLLVYGSGNSAALCNIATDNNTNTIANATTGGTSSVSGTMRIDYVASCHAGANTVTLNAPSTGQDVHLHIWEISGCATASPVRDSGVVNSSATASVSTAGSTTLSGDAVTAFFYDFPAQDTLTIGAGYTSSDLSQDASSGDAMFSEFKAAGSGGTQTATCGGNAAHTLAQIIVTWKQATATFQPDEDYWPPPLIPPPEWNVTVW